MKIIADENIHRLIIRSLRVVGFDVVSIQEESAGIDDEEILHKFSLEDSIILTQDKDFGDLTFLQKMQIV